MIGHWIEKCLKLHPYLHPKKEKQVMETLDKEKVEECARNTITIPEIVPEGSEVQKANYLACLGKKWLDYLSN